LAGAIGFFLVLEFFTRLGLVDRVYLPPASTVLTSMAVLLMDPGFLGEVAATLLAWAVGLTIAVGLAVPAGAALGSSNLAYRGAQAVVEFLRPIPSVALIPLAVLLYGQGLQMKVFLIAYAASWPILVNAIYGVHDVDPVAKETARSFGFGRMAILARVSLPSAAPFIATGVRTASAVALIIAVAAELVAGAESGIGKFIVEAGSSGERADLVYAATAVAGLLGFLTNFLLVRVERRLFAWQPEGASS
jgi:NitT/TauT family transport system permease protein